MLNQIGQLHAVKPLVSKRGRLQVIKGRVFRMPVQREQARSWVDGVFYV